MFTLVFDVIFEEAIFGNLACLVLGGKSKEA